MLELAGGTLFGDFLKCLGNISHHDIDIYQILISSHVRVSKPTHNSSLRMLCNFILFFQQIEKKKIQLLRVKVTTIKGDDPQKSEPPKGITQYTKYCV